MPARAKWYVFVRAERPLGSALEADGGEKGGVEWSAPPRLRNCLLPQVDDAGGAGAQARENVTQHL